MEKNILSLGIFAVVILLFSCSSKTSKKDSLVGNNMSLECANKVVKYYDTSLNLLKNMVREKEMDEILKFMEQRGTSPVDPNIAPSVILTSDSVTVMEPDTCFDIATRQELQRAYGDLFKATQKFYANYQAFQTYIKSRNYKKDNYAGGAKLLEINSTLSTKMMEDKQVIYDMLSTYMEQANQVLSANKSPNK